MDKDKAERTTDNEPTAKTAWTEQRGGIPPP